MVSAQELAESSALSQLGWDDLLQTPIAVSFVEGDHFGIVGASAEPLAERLEYYMNKALEG